MRQRRFVFVLIMLFLAGGLIRPLSAQECNKPARKAPVKSAGVDSQILDINRIGCWFSNNGIIGEDPAKGADGFYFPSGQDSLSIIYTAGFWFVGKVDEEIRSAVACYGSEFQPGVILPDGNADDPELEKYKVYKFNRGETVDPLAIEQGCPSEVLGDQMLFSVFNDLTDHSNLWGSAAIGLEVRQTAWAYALDRPLGNVIFIRYHIVNKGADPVDSAYVAMWFDTDLGNANDDYTGCDPSLGMGFTYNGDAFDEKYGADVPSMGCDFFQGPLVDAPGETAVLPDGTVIQEKKILGMTAYFVYI